MSHKIIAYVPSLLHSTHAAVIDIWLFYDAFRLFNPGDKYVFVVALPNVSMNKVLEQQLKQSGIWEWQWEHLPAVNGYNFGSLDVLITWIYQSKQLY